MSTSYPSMGLGERSLVMSSGGRRQKNRPSRASIGSMRYRAIDLDLPLEVSRDLVTVTRSPTGVTDLLQDDVGDLIHCGLNGLIIVNVDHTTKLEHLLVVPVCPSPDLQIGVH